MIRKIIQIDSEKCNGCGLCAESCHEGAIGMVEGKAVLLRDDYCDGLGNCLPVCSTGAIRFTEREALAYNEVEVKKNMEQKIMGKLPCGCPGSNAKTIVRDQAATYAISQEETAVSLESSNFKIVSLLNQWPVQIKLVPVNAPYFDGAKLLIAADCAAYAYANFHEDFMKGKITLIGCPKLDEGDYSEKLTAILQQNNIKSVTVVRMEVPCCGGIESAVIQALQNCKKMIPWQTVTLSTDGRIVVFTD